MKIAIDITRAIIENAGIGRYAREIAQNILEIDSADQFTLLATHFNSNDEKVKRLKQFIKPNVKISRIKLPGSFKELAWGWPWGWYEKSLGQSEVLFAPSFFEVSLGFSLPQVVTIHDMATFLYPLQRGKKVSRRHNIRVRKVCQKVKKIIAMSESTKKDLIRLLKVKPDKIQVIYPGKTEFPAGGRLPKDIISQKYILFVGTLEPRKNLKNLLEAYKLLSDDIRTEYSLVIVGAKGWNTAEEIKDIKETQGVKWLGYVSDKDLGELYKNAYIFAYPSLYEGFGLPILEAQQFGVPVLTSNVSSLPEAVGDGGLQVDPLDTNLIAKGLEQLIEDKNLHQELAQKAKAHAEKFTWVKAARETLEVIRSVK